MKKFLPLLFACLLFSCDDDSNPKPDSGELKQIVIEKMTDPEAEYDVSGIYNLDNDREYSVREDGKYKILLTSKKYIEDKKEKEALTYGVYDVANKKYLYFTDGIDVAHRLYRNWEFYDKINIPGNEDKKLICTSKPVE